MRLLLVISVFTVLNAITTNFMSLSQSPDIALAVGPFPDRKPEDGPDFLIDLLKQSLADRSTKWRCLPTSKFVCSPERCQPNYPNVTVLLDFLTKTYQRCDEKGSCDTHHLSHSNSGIYTFASPGAGAFIKIVNDGRSFMEVASLGTDTFISYGECTESSGMR
ncbi:MAG: hypothetical protein AB7G68_06625 [Nitrospiraceae bacterium]